MRFNFTSAHNDYLDPDKGIAGWSDESIEIESTVLMEEGDFIHVEDQDQYFKVINVLNNKGKWKEYIITDALKKEVDKVNHFIEDGQIIFID